METYVCSINHANQVYFETVKRKGWKNSPQVPQINVQSVYFL